MQESTQPTISTSQAVEPTSDTLLGQSCAPEKTSILTWDMLTSRRTFLRVSGAAGLIALGDILALSSCASSGAGSAPSETASTTNTGGDTGSMGGTSSIIGNIKNLPLNSAEPFTVAKNDDPGVLIHLPNNQVVAFDAVCTHEGCTVAYNPDSKHLECPCHGSVFDPANQGKVLHGPARQPLTSIKITINNSTGNITQ